MGFSRCDPVIRRNTLLCLAACALLASLAAGVRLWLAFASLPMFVGVLSVIVSGCFAGLAITKLAVTCLGPCQQPWYAQAGATAFLVVALLAVDLIGYAALKCLQQALPIAMTLRVPAILLLAIAAQLACIALLDWPGSAPHPGINVHAFQQQGRPAPTTRTSSVSDRLSR